MIIPPESPKTLLSSKNGNTLVPLRPLVNQLWCKTCGNEVAEPATHDCTSTEDTVRKRKARTKSFNA